MAKLKISYTKILTAIILLVFIIFLNNLITNTNENTKIDIYSPENISESWILENKNISLPYSYNGKKYKEIVLCNTIPDNIQDGDVLSFIANYSINEIYIDNQLIYTYGNADMSIFGHMVGNIRCIVDLKEEYAGKTVTWKIIPYYSQTMEIPNAYIGEKAEIVLNILKINLWKLIAVALFFTMTIILAIILLYRKIKKIEDKDKIIKHITVFSFLSVTWLLNDSDIPQFLGYQNEAFCFLSFMCLTLLPPIFCGFTEGLYPENKVVFRRLKLIGILNVLIQLLLYVLNIKDPIEVLFFTHLIMIICLITALIMAIKTFKKDINSKIICFGIIGFIMFGILSIINFKIHPGSPNTSAYFTTGLVLIQFSQFGVLLIKELTLMKELASMSAYKKLAYKDILTNLDNRASMEKCMDEIIEKNNKKAICVGFIMCDINYLKETNDNFGHEAGDELIKGGAQCLNKTFSNIGTCYRLGGDEFAVIITKEASISKTLKQLENTIEEYNKSHRYKLSMAYGYSNDILYKKSLEDLRKLYKESDDNMYEMKQKQHNKKT